MISFGFYFVMSEFGERTDYEDMKNINQIVAVGSVDGVLTTAALLRVIGDVNVGLVFTQAFAVDKIDISGWQPNSRVAFVDLAVNNRDKAMTKGFVEKLRAAGHQIVAVCDEHSREDWLAVLGSSDGLLIEPQSQAEGVFKSSGAVLVAALGEQLDTHGKLLCDAADAADRMEFAGVGALVNQAVKSKIQDDTRRVHLAVHFADSTEPDDTILKWIKEYETILKTHEEILAGKQDLGNGIIRVSAVGKVVDMTTLMSTLYKGGARVVVLEGEIFDKAAGGKVRMVSFGTSEKLDLLNCVQQAVETASGFAQKVNVAPEAEAVALEEVRAYLKRLGWLGPVPIRSRPIAEK